jgi:hypothetical protein
MKKFFIVLIALSFMCAPSFAGEQPEFDTVGCDASNYFNDRVKDLVVANNINFDGRLMNEYSDFIQEGFIQTAGQAKLDPCFPEYFSHLVDAWNSAEFSWRIVLQKKPDTDLDINIRDCVLKMNSPDPFGDSPFDGASQTGRYVMPWGQPFWLQDSNPRITATAFPGQYATTGFNVPFILDARTTPGLNIVPLQEVLYTSKGVWEESIVVVLPETGALNSLGQSIYRLKQGDMIQIDVAVPGTNTVDLYYGPDNVSIKYVGIHGTEYLSDVLCAIN